MRSRPSAAMTWRSGGRRRNGAPDRIPGRAPTGLVRVLSLGLAGFLLLASLVGEARAQAPAPGTPDRIFPLADPALDATRGLIRTMDDHLVVARRQTAEADPETDEIRPVVFGQYLNVDKDPTAREIGYDADFYNIAVGAEYRSGRDSTLGMVIGLGKGDFDVEEGDLEYESYFLSAYGTWVWGDFFLNVNGVAGLFDLDDIRRPTGVDGIVATSDNVHSAQLAASATAGFDMTVQGIRVTPEVGFQHAYISTEGFSEQAADPDITLRVRSQDTKSTISHAGFRLAYDFLMPGGRITPSAFARYEHEYNDDENEYEFNIPGGVDISQGVFGRPSGDPFSLVADRPDRNFARVGAALDGEFAGSVHARLSFDTVVENDDRDEYLIFLRASVGF